MGVVLGFLVGWAVGAKAGVKGFDEVVGAARTVKESEEFAALVAVTRIHVAAALQEVGTLVAGTSVSPEGAGGDLLDKVRRLTAPKPR